MPGVAGRERRPWSRVNPSGSSTGVAASGLRPLGDTARKNVSAHEWLSGVLRTAGLAFRQDDGRRAVHRHVDVCTTPSEPVNPAGSPLRFDLR